MENEIIETAPDFGPLDVIGTLFNAPVEEEAPTALPGWHVNSPWPIATFAAQSVTPTTPRRVFAGGVTVFYTFANEAEFLSLLQGADLSRPEPVPTEVTDLQALLAIDAAGLSSAYQAWATSPDRTFAQKAFIERAKVWKRNDTTLTAAAAALGLGDEDIDNLFRLGATL